MSSQAAIAFDSLRDIGKTLSIDRSMSSQSRELVTTNIRDAKTHQPVYCYFTKRTLTRSLSQSYVDTTGVMSKKNTIEVGITTTEQRTFAALDEWAVRVIARSKYYGEASTLDTVKSKYKSLAREGDGVARLGVFKDSTYLYVVEDDNQDGITYDDSNDFDGLLVDRNETEIIVRLGCVWMSQDACGITVNVQRLMVWVHTIPFFDHMNVKLIKKQRVD